MERARQLPLKKPFARKKTTIIKKGHLSKMEGLLFVFLKRKTFIKKKKKPKRHALAPESLTTLT